MKKNCLLVILAFILIGNVCAQDKLSETERLASFCKIYGFLKYYHPNVSKGSFDWDKEFFKTLPLVLEVSDKDAISSVYLEWIHDLGEIEQVQVKESTKTYFDKNFDLSWIQDSLIFSQALIDELKYIEQNRNKKTNAYVSFDEIKLDQINEPIYPELKFPNEEYRLLGLFRYWNIIEYFYPYKYLTDQSWDSVLLEMIPKMRSVSNKDDYHFLLLELVAQLDDAHAWIRTSDEKSKFLPFIVSQIEGKPVVSEILNDSLAQIIDVKLGDVVMKMNGYDFQNLVVENLKFQAGSNKNIKLRYVYNYILNKANDSVQVTVERNGQLVEVKSQYYNYQEIITQNNLASLGYKLLSESVGYMDLQFIKSGKQVIEIFKSLKNEKAIIIDLRTYPALIHLGMSKFLNSEKRTFALTFSPSIEYPSRFEYNLELKTMSSKKAFSGKVFLLVNEKSLSKAEFVAMSLQTADNIITIGSQTAGADGNVVIVDYLGGYRTAFTGNGVMYPDGTETQRTGVKVDIEVNPTINGLRAGRDEVLEKALQLASEL